jgi:ribosomal protein S6
VKRYEGLFILNTAGREEGAKEAIDRITAEITAAGGKIETVQKMDKRPFARVADRKHASGFFVNIIFEGDAKSLTHLRHKFAMSEEVFRVLFTNAQPVTKVKPVKPDRTATPPGDDPNITTAPDWPHRPKPTIQPR